MTEPPAKDASGAATTGTWAALDNTVFRRFWLFSFFAFIGASMQTVGAGWLMTQLDPSPAKVAMIQAAFSLSAFVMGLPAGVLADLIDRRWIMLGSLAGLMLFAGVLGVVTLTGVVTPNLLIALTFLFGLSAAALTPAMQATTPDLVPRLQLPSALTLNGMNNSVARAVGPALAGLLLGGWGPGVMFVLNVVAFVGLFIVISLWRNQRPADDQPRQRFLKALIEGITFSLHQAPLRRLLIKMLLNFLMLSILLALIPSVVDQLLDGRPQTLGLLLACFGLGSFAGSLLLSRLYARMSRSRVIDLATATHAIAVLIVGLSSQKYFSAAATFLAGMSWTLIMTSVNIVAQLLLPARMRARGLSINMMTLMGSLALGAALWGQVAEVFGLREAFLTAALAGLIMPLLTSRMRLVEELDDGPAVPAGDAAPAPAGKELR
jgi:MFS family permease